jgi:hypothetical protein
MNPVAPLEQDEVAIIVEWTRFQPLTPVSS